MTIQLACIAFDCGDALAVGTFWSEALGRPLDPGATNEFASIGFAARREVEGWRPVERADDPTWLFAKVPESKAVKNRVHPDLIASDVESEIARLLRLGASRVADRDEYGYRWTLMADPEGNEFDLGQALQPPEGLFAADAVATFGKSMMDPATRPPAARAGFAQGAALAVELGAFWR